MRTTAQPATARPSISKWRPLRLAAASENASPRPSSRSTACCRFAAMAGSSHEAKASTRRGEGASATSEKSPSMRGSPSGRSQASRICGSLARNRLARSSAARVRVSSLASSASRWVQRRRPTRCSEAVSTEKNNSSRMTRPLRSVANGSSSASGPPPASARAAPAAQHSATTTSGATTRQASARRGGPPNRMRALADRVVSCKPRPPETFAGAPAAGRRRRRSSSYRREERINVLQIYAKPPRKSLTECWRILSEIGCRFKMSRQSARRRAFRALSGSGRGCP